MQLAAPDVQSAVGSLFKISQLWLLMQSNMESKANGALMRITPLAVWAHQLSQDQLVQAARSDAQLTHPNQTCQVTTNAASCSRLPI